METTKGSKRKSTQPKSNSNDDDDPVLQQKRVKRRIQNRNSQKCYREKQVSYIRTLEKIVSNVVPATDPVSSSQTAQSQLLLIKENQQLQDALLRMRKKFLSLSSAAAMGADDPVFQNILNRQPSPPEQITENSPRSNSLEAASSIECDDQQDITGSSQRPTVESISNPAPELETIFPDSFPHNQMVQSDFASASFESLHSNSAAPDHSIYSLTPLPTLHRTLAETLHAGDVSTTADIPGVETTMKAFMDRMNDLDDSEKEKSISQAVRLMLKQSPLVEGYLCLLGGTEVVEKVIQWRIMPTSANRDKIPPPFRPTILQQHFAHRHHCIDFLPWAELRDQVLLHMGDIDLVQFGSDTMLNLVHDVPQLNVSLPSVETYCVLAQILQNKSQQRAFNPLEQLLGLNDLDNDIAPLQPHSKVFRAVKKYRLDVISERKLSQQFADKYPFLDLTNFVTRLPIVSFGNPMKAM